MFKKDDQENIETLSIRHSGLIPEGHLDREKVAQHINKLRTSNPNEARRLYDRFISGGGQYTKEKPEINVKISKSEKIDPQGHYVKIESNPNWHRVLDVKDTGISASKPGGGNSYKIRCNKTGNISNVHQSKITDYVFGEDIASDLKKTGNDIDLVLSNYFEGSHTSPHEYHYSVHKDGNEIGRAIVFNKDPRSIHSQGREGASLKDIRIKPEFHGKGFSGYIINSLVQKHGPLASDSRGNISEAGHKMFSKYGSAVKSKENKNLYMLGGTMEKSDKNHPKGGLSRKEAKKLGIHAGIETHDEVERKGGVSKLSDKTSARRRSFCARHCGMKRKFPKAYKDPQSKGNKALRVWHCGSCSNWLKKSIGNNDAVRFYEDNENLIIEFDNDVPSEIETLVVASVLAKGFEENE